MSNPNVITAMLNSNVIIAIATVLYVALTVAVVFFMRRQSRAQEEMAKLQRFHMLAMRMEDVRHLRREVREYIRKCKEKDGEVFPLPNEIRDAVDKVGREFDYLGLLDRTGLVDSRLVDMFYAVPFVLLYNDILGSYAAEVQKPENRGPTHFWELVQFYERVKHVPDNHPGNTGKSDWPENPRLPSMA